MARKTEAYLDTSAAIAFLDRSDGHHDRFRQLFATPPPLVTSALVVAEGHGWFLRRFDASRGLQFLAFLAAVPGLTVVAFDADALAHATPILKKYSDQDLTLADAHGLVIMADRRVKQCWSTDRHLGLTGVPLVT